MDPSFIFAWFVYGTYIRSLAHDFDKHWVVAFKQFVPYEDR
jgi:hypothetical protein